MIWFGVKSRHIYFGDLSHLGASFTFIFFAQSKIFPSSLLNVNYCHYCIGTAKKGHFPQWAVYVCILPLNSPPLLVYKWMLRTVLFSIFVYFGKVTNELNIATNVNNWHYSVSKGAHSQRKKGKFSCF